MKKLNSMCETCARLSKDCEGTTCQTWTGCVIVRKIKKKESLHFTSATLSGLVVPIRTEYALIAFNTFVDFQILTQ